MLLFVCTVLTRQARVEVYVRGIHHHETVGCVHISNDLALRVVVFVERDHAELLHVAEFWFATRIVLVQALGDRSPVAVQVQI